MNMYLRELAVASYLTNLAHIMYSIRKHFYFFEPRRLLLLLLVILQQNSKLG